MCNSHKWNHGDLGHLYFYYFVIHSVGALVTDITDSFASSISSRSCTFPQSYHSDFGAFVFTVYRSRFPQNKYEAEKSGTHSLGWVCGRCLSTYTDNVDSLWVKCK